MKIVTPQPINAINARPAELTPAERRALASEGSGGKYVFAVSGSVRLPVPAGQTWRIYLATSGQGRAVLNVVARVGERVLGGSRYVMRTK